jgi:hypothetical protein
VIFFGISPSPVATILCTIYTRLDEHDVQSLQAASTVPMERRIQSTPMSAGADIRRSVDKSNRPGIVIAPMSFSPRGQEAPCMRSTSTRHAALDAEAAARPSDVRSPSTRLAPAPCQMGHA